MINQNPEQIARDNIDKQLRLCEWIIQDKKKLNLAAGLGIAIREYQTDIDPADYVHFVDRKAVGIIEAKREEESLHLTSTVQEQAKREFRSYTANDHNRLFTELYSVTRLSSSFIPNDSQIYISTIQRMYSILKETELDESEEEKNPNEIAFEAKTPTPVGYNEKVPIEFFDFVVIDKCHKSIYNLWKQVLDYFDVFQIGLTATPDNRTFGYFNQNLVYDYGYEKAVIDGVLIPLTPFHEQYLITQEIESRLSVADKMEESITQSLQQIEALRQSILKRRLVVELV